MQISRPALETSGGLEPLKVVRGFAGGRRLTEVACRHEMEAPITRRSNATSVLLHLVRRCSLHLYKKPRIMAPLRVDALLSRTLLTLAGQPPAVNDLTRRSPLPAQYPPP